MKRWYLRRQLDRPDVEAATKRVLVRGLGFSDDRAEKVAAAVLATAVLTIEGKR